MTDFENDARKVLAVFLARPVFIVVGIVAVVVFGLCWKQNADANRDGQNTELSARIAAQAIVIDSLTKLTKLADVRVAAAVDTFVVRDTAWRRHTDTLNATVTRIVTSKVADTTKIAELAALVLATRDEADDAIKAAEFVVATLSDFRVRVTAERASWATQSADMQKQIKLLSKQSRHWGLGATLGAGALRSSDGVIRAGPVLAVGVVYRY